MGAKEKSECPDRAGAAAYPELTRVLTTAYNQPPKPTQERPMAKTQFDYDPTQIVPQELWDMEQIIRNPLDVRVREEETVERDGRKVVRREIYYTSHVFRGTPVRIAAHVAIPESDKPLPAMVLGTSNVDGAESMAVTHNVVAIAIDRPGVGDSNGPPDLYNESWLDLTHDPRDGWMWQFITSAMRAITYAQTLPQVNPGRIGVTGGSRGGTMSFIANGVDPRITLAIPTATAGDILLAFKHDGWANNLYTDEDGDPGIPDTFRVFALYGDPIQVAKTQHGAVMLILGAQDEFFPIYTVKTTCDAVTSPDFRLCLIPDWDHGLFGQDIPECDTYNNRDEASRRIAAATRWAIQCHLHDARPMPPTPDLSWLPEGNAMHFSATVDQSWPVKGVSLCHSTDSAYFFKREPMAKVLDCFKEKFQCTLDMADVDDDQTAFFVEVEYEDGPFIMSPPEFGLRFKQRIRTSRPPGPEPEFMVEDVEYGSSIDDLSGLKAKISYNKQRKGAPIVVLLAGGTPGSTKPLHTAVERWGRKGVFAVLPTLRGRDGSPGDADIMGREVYDILDAVEHVKAAYAEYVNPDLVSLVSYSAGAAVGLMATERFPDYFRTAVAFFPITDRATQPYWELYDREPKDENESKALRIAKMVEKIIRGTPAAAPDAYAARRTLSAAANARQTRIHMYHDVEDWLVPVGQSRQFVDAAKAAGLTNVRFYMSYPDDGRRWTHGHPDKIADLVAGEHKFQGQVTGGTPPKPTLPREGELVVLGYLRTEELEVWLGDGLESAATLTYSLADDSAAFSVAPLAGNPDAPVKVLLDAGKYAGCQAQVCGQAVKPTQEHARISFAVKQGEELVLKR